MSADAKLVEALRCVLVDRGALSADGIHNWRCQHGVLYPNWCNCANELIDDIARVVREYDRKGA